jgi:hypothetical protein
MTWKCGEMWWLVILIHYKAILFFCFIGMFFFYINKKPQTAYVALLFATYNSISLFSDAIYDLRTSSSFIGIWIWLVFLIVVVISWRLRRTIMRGSRG